MGAEEVRLKNVRSCMWGHASTRSCHHRAMSWHIVESFPVHWGEMDALGHVNHARFFTWFETARIALLAKIGVLAAGPSNMGPILANISCDYRKPVVFPATVSIGARVTAVGRTSITMVYSVWIDNTPEVPHATATSVIVLVDYTTLTKVPVPDLVREKIAALDNHC